MFAFRSHAPATALLTAVAVLAVPATGRTQVANFPRLEVLASGGPSFPLGPFNDSAGIGYVLGFNAGWRLAPGSTVGIAIDRVKHGASDRWRQEHSVDANQDASFAIWFASLYFKQMAFGTSMRPYLRVHVGMIDFDPNVDGAEIEPIDARLGLAGGGGLHWKSRGPVGIYTEALFHQAVVQERNERIESDLRSFVTWRAGVAIDIGAR